MRVHDFLLSAGREIPERTALEFRGAKIPYGVLADEATRVGAAIRAMGVAPGESIGLMMPNIPPFVATLFGALAAGCRVVPMNVLLTPPEIRYLVEDSSIRAVFCWEGFAPRVAEAVSGLPWNVPVVAVGEKTDPHLNYHRVTHPSAVDVASFVPVDSAPDDAAITVYTSGTTGKPKGAVLTHGNIVSNIEMMEGVFRPLPEDKALCVLPLFHVFALNAVLIAGLRNRSSILLHPKFEVEDAIRSLAEEGVTTFAGVPTMYFYILKTADPTKVRFPTLRFCFSGGAAMPVDVLRQFEAAFDVPLCEGYGLTETTVSCCCNRPDGVRKPGSIGQPLPRSEMRVVNDAGEELPNGEVGEIVVRGPMVMREYHGRPEATAEAIRDGWFFTGDLGYRDDEGYFYIVDRKKDMIIKGGYNIYPREIEEVIYAYPGVAEAAVVGFFDPAKGEAVRAVVAPRPGVEIGEAELAAHLEANLAKYKLPNEYQFVKELPKGPTGKILKRELVKDSDRWNKDRAPAAG